MSSAYLIKSGTPCWLTCISFPLLTRSAKLFDTEVVEGTNKVKFEIFLGSEEGFGVVIGGGGGVNFFDGAANISIFSERFDLFSVEECNLLEAMEFKKC